MEITVNSSSTCTLCSEIKKVYEINDMTIVCIECFGRLSNFVSQMERYCLIRLEYTCN